MFSIWVERKSSLVTVTQTHRFISLSASIPRKELCSFCVPDDSFLSAARTRASSEVSGASNQSRCHKTSSSECSRSTPPSASEKSSASPSSGTSVQPSSQVSSWTILNSIGDNLNTWILLTKVFTYIIHQRPCRSPIKHNTVKPNQWAVQTLACKKGNSVSSLLNCPLWWIDVNIVSFILTYLCFAAKLAGAATGWKIAVTRRHPRATGCA